MQHLSARLRHLAQKCKGVRVRKLSIVQLAFSHVQPHQGIFTILVGGRGMLQLSFETPAIGLTVNSVVTDSIRQMAAFVPQKVEVCRLDKCGKLIEGIVVHTLNETLVKHSLPCVVCLVYQSVHRSWRERRIVVRLPGHGGLRARPHHITMRRHRRSGRICGWTALRDKTMVVAKPVTLEKVVARKRTTTRTVERFLFRIRDAMISRRGPLCVKMHHLRVRT